MNEIPLDENREPEEILLDAPATPPEAAQTPLQHWLRTHTDTPDENADSEAPPDPARPRRWRGLAGGACALILAAAAITLAPHPRPQSSIASASVVAAPAVSDHPVELVSGTSSGCAHSAIEQQLLAAGQVRDGGQAIAVFESAYYRDRDGVRARALVAGSAAVADASAIQAGIDSIPAGTTYCARIHRLDLGLYGVEIHEARPGEPESIWRQQISTSDHDGHTLITAITQL